MITSKNFPDFLIVGAAKSGTTSLHSYLSSSAQVFMPKRKELNFWYTEGKEYWAIMKRFPDLPKSISEYLEYFDYAKKDQLKGEASPGYMVYYQETINNLKKYHPNWKDLKIIILLREPISKIWSHYQMVKRANMDPEKLDLSSALRIESERVERKDLLLDIKYIFNTSYLKQVKAFIDEFKSVKIILFDDLISNPQLVLDDISDFLGIDCFVPKNIGKKMNAAPKSIKFSKSRLARIVLKVLPQSLKGKLMSIIDIYLKEKMSKQDINYIQEAFNEDLKILNSMIEPDISHWFKEQKNSV